MARSNQFRWQAPGNGRLFDSSLKEWKSSKMSQRCIGVLQFLNENPSISKNEFEIKIDKYLKNKYGHEPNNSNKAHFYRPLEFIGFIRNIHDSLSLSIDGKNFLHAMLEDNFELALQFFVLQLFKTSYPNKATEDNKLSLFPFRIMFKLLSKNEPHNGLIPKKLFYIKIPYITSYEDIKSLLNILLDDYYIDSLEHYSLKNLKQKSSQYYEKWYIWVVASLREMNILEETGNKRNIYVKLSNPINEFIQDIVDYMHYEDMFFKSGEEFLDIKNNIRNKSPNHLNIQETLENNPVCFFNDKHDSFLNYTNSNKVEGHYIIPLSLNDSFDEELDCKENLIVLCPYCHDAIHYATNEFKEVLLKLILEKNKKFTKFNLSLEDLEEIYFNKKNSRNL
jgi:5-methylcytosine-specific restriction enzyme A